MKKLLGSFLGVAVMCVALLMIVNTKTRAGTIREMKNMYNQIRLVTDTTAGKVLKAGDTYKIELSVDDEGINDPTSVKVYQYYTHFNGGMGDGVRPFDATSFSHDTDNHCYNIVLEGMIKDDDEIGIWHIYGVEFIDDSDCYYETTFAKNEWQQYVHYVIDASTLDQLVLSEQLHEFRTGETFQLKAYVLPALTEDNVVWSSDNDTIATVDNTGKVTAKALGDTFIQAKYKDSSFLFRVVVTEEPGINYYETLKCTLNKSGDTLSNRVLKAGDTFEVTFSIPDDKTGNVVWARLHDYRNADGKNGRFSTTKITHDEVNKCFIITFNGKIVDEKNKDYRFDGVALKDSNGHFYYKPLEIKYSVQELPYTERQETKQPEVEEPSIEQPVVVEYATPVAVNNQTQEQPEQTPQTGDEFPIDYLLLTLVSAAVLVIAIVDRKRKKALRHK